MAQTLNEAKYSSLSIQTGLVDATLNEHEWKWLSDQTGLTDRSLNELWIALLSSMGYTTGNLNERQMKSWADMGAPQGSWNEMAYWFYTDGNASYGPTVTIQRNNDPGFCEYQPPDTVFCAASETYTAIDRNFSGSALSYSWSVTGGTAIITGSNISQTCTVETQNSGEDQTFELSVTVSNADPETADRTTTFTQPHTDINVAPAYIGPNINSRDYTVGVAITPVETFNLFTGTNLEFSLQPVGDWPTGLQIDSATGQITGTPTGAEQEYPGIFVRVTNSKGTADSTQFSITLISGAIAPLFDNGPVPAQQWEVGTPIAQFPIGQYFATGSFPRTYTIESGALPTGLTMNTAGQINGTPTVEGEQGSAVIRCTNAAGFALTNEWNWIAWEAIVFDTIADREYQLNVPVSVDAHDFLISGTVTNWTLLGTWPPGFAIDNNGIITGTPTVDETYTGLQLRADNPWQSRVDSNVFRAKAGDPVILPAFWALTPDPDTYEMLGVREGVGGLTTTHTSDLYAPDFEGVYREFGANEPVWSGGYVLRNELTYSNDLRNTAEAGASRPWIYSGTPTVTYDQVGLTGEPNTATYLEDLSAAAREGVTRNVAIPNDSSVNTLRCFVDKDTDETRVPQFSLALNGGTLQQNNVQINTQTGASLERNTVGTVSSEIKDDGDRWEILISVANNSSGNTNAAISIYPAFGDSLGGTQVTATGSIIVGNAELHLNKTIAEVKVPTDGWIFTIDSPQSKVWAIDGTGAALADVPYLQYYPAAENKVPYSNQFDNVAWTPTDVTVSQTIAGLDGAPNGGALITQTTNVLDLHTSPVVTTAGLYTAVGYFRKSVSTSLLSLLAARGQGDWVSFNPQTGAYDSDSGTVTYEIIDMGDVFKVLIEGTSSTTLGVSVLPDYNGTGASVACLQVEMYPDKTIAEVRGLGPIFTTTAAVNTDATVYSFDVANHETDLSAYYMEFTSPIDGPFDNPSASQARIIDWSTASWRVARSAGSINISDGANTASSPAILTGAGNKLGIAYGDLEMSVNTNNTWGFDSVFDGNMNASQIRLGYLFNSAFGMSELKRWNTTSLQDGKDIVEEEMGP